MRKSLVLLCGVAAFLGMNVAAMAETKIAVIDVQQILSESPQVKEMRTKLQAQFAPQQKEVADLQKTLQADMDKYSKNNAVMKDQEKKELQDKILGEQKTLRDKQSSFQQSVMAEQEKSMQVVSKQIQGIVEKVAKDKKFDLVIAKGATAYNDPAMDVTKDVVAEMKK